MVTWTPTQGGNCEAVPPLPWGRGCGRRARWEGPPTATGGNLYCGYHKKEREQQLAAAQTHKEENR